MRNRSNKVNSRLDDIDISNWIQFEKKRINSFKDGIRINFSKPSEKRTIRCCIKFSHEIIKKVSWKKGDKLLVLYNPDDIYEWIIVKAQCGYTLTSSNRETKILQITFTWKDKEEFINNIPLENKFITENIEVSNDKMLFRVI